MDKDLAVDSLTTTQILNREDFEYVTQHINTLQHNWEKNQLWRTETEMRVSVLNDLRFPTPASKYWQAVREQANFYANLITTSFDYRRNQVHQLQKRNEIDCCEDDLARELLQIDLEELQFAQIRMEREAADRVREIRLWDKIMQECVEQDPNFDQQDVNAHQMESYARIFRNRFEHMGSDAGPSEQANIVGQLQTIERVMKERESQISYSAKVHLLGD